MASTLHGNPLTSLVALPGARASYDKYGVITMEQRYSIKSSLALANAPAAWAVHPSYSYLQNDISRMEVDLGDDTTGDNIATIRCMYVGVTSGSTTPPIYEVELSSTEEPIDTHPSFVATLGGTRASPLNNAIFNSDGSFKAFPPDAGNSLGGVRSYLSPQATWRETTFATSSPPSIATLGQIQSPAGSPPSIGSGRNWLFVADTWSRQGNSYRRTREWRASGVGKWNALVYA